MRRGTQSAIFFGQLLLLIRTSQEKSMSQIGEKMGVPSSTVSQIERGERALKEPKIEIWASAFSVSKIDLEDLWWLAQGMIRVDSKTRVFYSDYVTLRHRILIIMDRYVIGSQDIYIPKIEKPLPITRQRYKTLKTNELEDLVKLLYSSERNRVQGYVEALLECRSIPNPQTKKEQ